MRTRSLRLALSCLSLTSLSLAACDSPPAEPEDSGPQLPDSGPPPSCDGPVTFEQGDPNGHADPLRAPAGQSRAGRLTEAGLPMDRTGLGGWRAGDFVLANDRVALIIEDVGNSDLYDPYGGRPIGLARVDNGALVDAGDFNEVIFGFGAFVIATERVTVLADGADGGPAIVRAEGLLGPLEFAGDLLTGIVPGNFEGLPAVMDYELRPGSDAVDVSLTVGTNTPRGARATMVLTAFLQHHRMPFWLESGGFVTPSGQIPGVWFIDDRAASYAWLAPEGNQLTTIIEQSGIMIFSNGSAAVPGCSTSRIPLGTMVLGGNGLPGLQQAVARHRGETLRTVTGAVTGASGPDVRVHVRRADGRHFARLTPAPEDGTFTIDVPNETVSFWVFRAGVSLVGPVEVPASEASVELVMPSYGVIAVDVHDAADPTGPTIPARVQVIPSGGAPMIPGELGELVHNRGRAHVAFTTSGMVELVVEPGRHQVVVSRGFEYEIFTANDVEVGEGERVTVSALLDRSVTTPGVMCADYHIHTHRSPDSPDSPQLKLEGLIADGLEIAVRSDHEWITDFQPLIESLGLQQYAFGISGEELTTFAWGHFGVFPLTEDPSRRNNGAVEWVGRLPPAVFEEARDRPEAPAFIINHPRSAGTIGGYFTAAGFDRATGQAGRPEYWDEEFTLVEVFNDGDMEEHAEVVADWFAFLNSQRRVFAVGSSDSHGIWGSPVGYPRTCLALGTDDPRDLTPNMVRDVTAAGHSTISGGLYLTVLGPNGEGPGDDVIGAGETALFDVTVQAAAWIRGVDRLEVIVDGAVVETIPITEAGLGEGAIRLEATGIEVPVAPAGSWVVFHAAATEDLSPVHPGRAAFAVSNPVFLTR